MTSFSKGAGGVFEASCDNEEITRPKRSGAPAQLAIGHERPAAASLLAALNRVPTGKN
jgi:hypothetical protein